MKTITKIIAMALIVISFMFAEYRFIMHNIRPYLGENNTVYLEIFEQVDVYYAENINE